jgi:hypothetical protein
MRSKITIYDHIVQILKTRKGYSEKNMGIPMIILCRFSDNAGSKNLSLKLDDDRILCYFARLLAISDNEDLQIVTVFLESPDSSVKESAPAIATGVSKYSCKARLDVIFLTDEIDSIYPTAQLLAANRVIGIELHEGVAFATPRENMWTVTLWRLTDSGRVALQAQVICKGGTDSAGIFFVYAVEKLPESRRNEVNNDSEAT